MICKKCVKCFEYCDKLQNTDRIKRIIKGHNESVRKYLKGDKKELDLIIDDLDILQDLIFENDFYTEEEQNKLVNKISID